MHRWSDERWWDRAVIVLLVALSALLGLLWLLGVAWAGTTAALCAGLGAGTALAYPLAWHLAPGRRFFVFASLACFAIWAAAMWAGVISYFTVTGNFFHGLLFGSFIVVARRAIYA